MKITSKKNTLFIRIVSMVMESFFNFKGESFESNEKGFVESLHLLISRSLIAVGFLTNIIELRSSFSNIERWMPILSNIINLNVFMFPMFLSQLITVDISLHWFNLIKRLSCFIIQCNNWSYFALWWVE